LEELVEEGEREGGGGEGAEEDLLY